MSDDDPTAIFEQMYGAAAAGGPVPPWERGAPHPLLETWGRDLDGAGRRALVVGSGLGNDAEFIAARGFDVVAFDVSPTAVRMARERNPGSPVDYVVADLLDLPAAWRQAFELVVECLTVQSLPPALHAPTSAAVAGAVAPGGTLIVVATAGDGDPDADGPPWPLARREVEAFAKGGLEVVAIEDVRDPGVPPRWRAEFRRPPAA
jgi:SAM-dependent methyltransferase